MITDDFDSRFDWNDAKLFLQIARTGTLTAASRRLKLSQPTAGRRLKALEQAVGMPLFHHDGSRYQLTDAGEVMLLHAERIEEEALAVGRRLIGADPEIEGVVKVTASDWFSHRVLSRPISQFVIENPSVTVELVADPRLLDLRRREADLGFRFAPFSDPRIIQRRFVDVRYGLYAATSYLGRLGYPDEGGDSASHQLISLDSALDSAADVAWLCQRWPNGRFALRSNSRESQAEACVQGAGLAVLPRVLGDALPLHLLEGHAPPGRIVYLSYHSDLKPLRRLRSLVDFLTSSVPRQI